jgi:uncharacterized protein
MSAWPEARELTARLRLAVLQPTSLCNLNCSYCYVPDRQVSGLMSDEVLTAAARFIFSAAPERRSFEVVWHAGEPLVAGLSFYRRAFALLAELAPADVRITQSVQTNGTLINDAWCELFAEYGVKVGLSIDGPAWLHDAHRTSWAGRGSHERVMRGYERLRAHGIMPFALCVLTKDSLDHPDAVYDFFVESGFRSVGFNVDETEGENDASSLADNESNTLNAYRSFMRRLWHRWRAEESRIHIREFQQQLGCIQDIHHNRSSERRPDEVIPFGIVTIKRDGAVSTFAPELASTSSKEYNDFVIGNVLTDDPTTILEGAPFKRLARDVAAGRDACRLTCPYFAMCGAGFQSNRIAEHGSLRATETLTCRIHRKVLTDVVLDSLLDESRKLQARRDQHALAQAT